MEDLYEQLADAERARAKAEYELRTAQKRLTDADRDRAEVRKRLAKKQEEEIIET